MLTTDSLLLQSPQLELGGHQTAQTVDEGVAMQDYSLAMHVMQLNLQMHGDCNNMGRGRGLIIFCVQ